MRVVICDFDGTIIRGNLENTFLRFLLKETVYRWRILIISLFTLPINLLLNKFYIPSIFKSWTYVLKGQKSIIIDDFLNSSFFKDSVFLKYREDVIAKLSAIEYDYLLILTGSDEDLVRAFLRIENRFKFDEVIGSKVEKNFFRVKRHPYGKAKMEYVNRDNYNIGIANDYSDHFYMDMCNEKYYV